MMNAFLKPDSADFAIRMMIIGGDDAHLRGAFYAGLSEGVDGE